MYADPAPKDESDNLPKTIASLCYSRAEHADAIENLNAQLWILRICVILQAIAITLLSVAYNLDWWIEFFSR